MIVTHKVYWCKNCNVPIIKEESRSILKCPVCESQISYLSTDIRSVFSEERLLFELMTNKKPNSLIEKSIWRNKSTYYVNGIPFKLDNKQWNKFSPNMMKQLLKENGINNSYFYFEKFIQKFVLANKSYFNYE